MAITILKLIKPRIVFKHFLVRRTSSYKLTERDTEEIQIPVPWGHISGKWWGDKNEPPVVAVHGWQDNANSFDKLIPLLNLPSVLAIDLPGHGLSSHFSEGMIYEFPDFVVILHRVKKHFGWSKMPLLTHSFGASLGFVYAAIFPADVKWLISTECIRCLLPLLTYDFCSEMSGAVDKFLRIEEYKTKQLNPSYKLSELISMYMERSVGSISHPEKALILLKRVLLPSESMNKHKGNGINDLEAFLENTRALKKTVSVEGQKDVHKYFEYLKLPLNTARKKFKTFSMDEADDKYYALKGDLSINVLMAQTCDEEFFLKAAEAIKCPVLSVRTKDGFLQGPSKTPYDRTLETLKTSSPYVEHHDIDGTHYVHLCEPENLAQIINNFIKKF